MNYLGPSPLRIHWAIKPWWNLGGDNHKTCNRKMMEIVNGKWRLTFVERNLQLVVLSTCISLKNDPETMFSLIISRFVAAFYQQISGILQTVDRLHDGASRLLLTPLHFTPRNACKSARHIIPLLPILEKSLCTYLIHHTSVTLKQ